MRPLTLQPYDQLRKTWLIVRVFMWTRAEKPLSQRYIVATEAIFEKSNQTVVDSVLFKTVVPNQSIAVSW